MLSLVAVNLFCIKSYILWSDYRASASSQGTDCDDPGTLHAELTVKFYLFLEGYEY
jgi:hypothetical protein